MPICQECDGHVSSSFARVFGNPETGDVNGCVECTKRDELLGGGGLA